MKISSIFIAAAMIAVVPVSSCTQRSSGMQHIDELIAAGDTVTESGLHNVFVISDAKTTSEMLDSGLFTTLDRLYALGMSDSEYCMAAHYADDTYIACKKEYINLLFPKADKFEVNGEDVTKADFDRIPASLILTAKGIDGGKKISLEVRNDVDDSNPAYKEFLENDDEWFNENKNSSIPATSDIVIDDFSTYPSDSRIYVKDLLRSREAVQNLPPEEKEDIILLMLGNRPYTFINEKYFMDLSNNEEAIKFPVSSLSTKKLSEIVRKAGVPVNIVELKQDTIYALSIPKYPG